MLYLTNAYECFTSMLLGHPDQHDVTQGKLVPAIAMHSLAMGVDHMIVKIVKLLAICRKVWFLLGTAVYRCASLL